MAHIAILASTALFALTALAAIPGASASCIGIVIDPLDPVSMDPGQCGRDAETQARAVCTLLDNCFEATSQYPCLEGRTWSPPEFIFINPSGCGEFVADSTEVVCATTTWLCD